MGSTDQATLILSSLEVASEQAEDLTPLVYPRFFERYPEMEVEFGNDADNDTKGRMLIKLMLELAEYAEGKVYPGSILRWISDHKEYGLEPVMYLYMLECLRDVVKELNGAMWNEDINTAWQAQFDKLMAYVNQSYAERG